MKKYSINILLLFITTSLTGAPLEEVIKNPYIEYYSAHDYGAGSWNQASCQDSKGVLYFGNENGLLIYNSNKWRLVDNPKLTNITALAVDKYDRLYIGTTTDFGYLEYGRAGTPLYITLAERHSFSNSLDNYVHTIFISDYGVYFCTDRLTFEYDNNHKYISSLTENFPNLPGVINNKSIIAIHKQRGLVSIGEYLITSLYGAEIIKASPKEVVFMIPYSDDSILIGMVNGKMYIYDIIRSKLLPFPHDMEEYSRDNFLLKAIKLDDNTFAFATRLGGIFFLDNKGRLLQTINSSHGLNYYQSFGGFMQDREGNLWTCLESGIARISPGQSITQQNNIPLEQLDPSRLNFDCRITRIISHTDPIVTDGSYNFSKKIQENYFTAPSHMQPPSYALHYISENNFFIFEYAALWFTTPGKIKYSTMLEGYDKEWSPWSKNTIQKYINLPENRYTFKVQAKNEYGFLSKISSYTFVIHPPWYRTIPAYIFYILIAMGIIFFIYKRYKMEKIRLEKIIQKRTQEIVEMDKQKTLFYQNITHELRTPLTLISGHTDKVLQTREYKNGTIAEDINIIDRNTKKMNKLISQLLDLSKIDFNAMEIEPKIFSYPEFIEYLAAGFYPLAKNNNINLTIDTSPYIELVYLDIQMIEDVITNLVSNAFKFTEANGNITITSHVLEDDRLEIIITDTGIGISRRHLPHIFDRFRQVDGSLSRKYEGTGIGLSLAREYTELHGGTIDVTSRLGEGSSFTINLPIFYKNMDISDQVEMVDLEKHHFIPPGHVDITNSRTEYKDLHDSLKKDQRITEKATILIVEDNPELLQFIGSTLEKFYTTQTALNGVEALAHLEQTSAINLIVSDIMMPEMDGYEFYQIIKKDNKLRHIPFIFMTAKTSIDEQVSGLEQGAIDYITKPFSIKTLLAKIKALLRFNKEKEVMYEKERFASIGKLVSAISHEILNPLAGMTGPVYYLQELAEHIDSAEQEDYSAAITYLDENIQRIDSIVKSLRSLNRYGVSEKKTISLYSLVENTLLLLKNRIQNDVNINVQIDEDITLSVNPGALSHILLNLVSNACDAVGGKGEIIIQGEKTLGGVSIAVEDNGCGIESENLPHIFDLYFTTKNYNEGSGFGLYFVKDLVVEMGWNIDVESTVGRGSVFTLREGQ